MKSIYQNIDRTKLKWFGAGALLVALLSFALISCGRRPSTAELGGTAEAAVATYVAPGDTDEYYLFYSGGHSGNVYVAGVPSMRHISTIPVFARYPATGYGFDEESKKMLSE